MKSFFLRIVAMSVLLKAASIGLAQVMPPALSERVTAADHIIIGVASKWEVLNNSGQPMRPPPGDFQGLTCRLTVEPAETIKSSGQPLPSRIQVTYSNESILSAEGAKRYYEGKRLIYFLRSKDFVPVNPLYFTEAIDAERNVREHILQDKNAEAAVRKRAESYLRLLHERKWMEAASYSIIAAGTNDSLYRLQLGIPNLASKEEALKSVAQSLEHLYGIVRPGTNARVRFAKQDRTLALVQYHHGDLDGFNMRLENGQWYVSVEFATGEWTP